MTADGARMWTGERNPSASPSALWDACTHEWDEVESMSANAVECTLCGAPGDLNRMTGEVYWPAT